MASSSRLESQSSFDKIRSELICSICLDPFQEPKILPCFHTFCKKCLEKATKSVKGALVCPTCRTKTTIHLEGEVERLPNNFLVCRIMETLAQEERAYICTSCDKNNEAKWKCLDCRRFLCESCYKEHHRIPLNRDTHRVRNANDYYDFPEPDSSVFSSDVFEKEAIRSPIMSCDNHKEKECELYCRDCKKSMCTLCFAVEHRNHEMQTIDQVANQQKDTIRKLLAVTQTTTKNVQSTLEEITKMAANIGQQHQDLLNHIEARVAEIIQVTQQKACELLLQLDEAKAQRLKAIEAQKLFLEMETLKLEGACEFANEVLSCDSPAQVMTWNDQLLVQLDELSKVSYSDITPDVNSFIDCTFDITNVKMCISKASVLSSNTIPSKTKLTVKGVAVEGKETSLEVTTVDKEGNLTYSFLDNIRLKLYSPKGEEIAVPPLKDLENGRYITSFKPQAPGSHRIVLIVRDEEAWKTPVTAYVSKDYMMIHHVLQGFGSKGVEGGEFSGPCFAAVDEKENILVAESQNNRIQLFDSLGNLKSIFGQEGKKLCEFRCPAATGFLKDGSLVFLDSYNSRVQILSQEGDIRSFGKEGNGDREFYYPSGLSVDDKNRIIVADTGNNCIKVFDCSGNLILIIGAKEQGKLKCPLSAVFSTGQFIVADSGNDCIKIFSEDGTLKQTFVTINNEKISGPCRVSADKNGFLLICEKGKHSIKVLDQHGKLLTVFGAGGTMKGYLMHPQSAVVTEYGKVVVADWGNNRIQIFG